MICLPRHPARIDGMSAEEAVHAWSTRPWAQEQAHDRAARQAMLARLRAGRPLLGERRIWRRHAMLAYVQAGGFGRVKAQRGAATDPNFSSVVLLCHFDGSNGATSTIDSSSYARAIGQTGSPTLSDAQAKFGGTSTIISTDTYWTVTDAVEIRLGTSQMTTEAWFYVTSSNSLNAWYTKGINTTGGILLGLTATGATFRANGTTDLTGSHSSIASTWAHAAWVRDASNVRRIYVGGTQTATDTLNYDNNDTAVATIGQGVSSSFAYVGYIDELRITKGVCRYPGGTSFSVPTAAFPNS